MRYVRKNNSYFINNKIVITLSIAFLCILNSACVQKETIPDQGAKVVNEWILQNMKTYYYWNQTLEGKSFNFQSPSNEFFESLLYKRGENDGDRFSWYQDSYQALLDNIYAKAPIDPGFAYNIVLINNDTYIQVAYVKRNSNALNAGLKRGKLITHINGTKVTSSNYQSLLGQVNLNLSLVKVDNLTSQISSDGNIFFQGNTDFFENPILMDSLYTLHDSGGVQKKVGYLVYNRFISDPESDSNEYDIELNRRLATLKAGGAEYYIIDLRYNRGGYMSCALRLASSLIASEYKDLYLGSMRFNADYQVLIDQLYGTGGRKDYFVSTIVDNHGSSTPIQRIEPGDGKLYFLVGPNTASASEILIWGLRAYSNNIMVGTNTRGKFMGSYSLYEENNPTITCGIQPLVCKYYDYNNVSGPMDGMVPDILLTNTSALTLYELGDEQEPLLQAAFESILPGRITTSLVQSKQHNKSSIHKKESFRNGLNIRVLHESIENSQPEGAIIRKKIAL